MQNERHDRHSLYKKRNSGVYKGIYKVINEDKFWVRDTDKQN